MLIVPVIIPFYRERQKLDRCLAAVAAQTAAGCEAFVRDNTHDNILFTAAVNEGLLRYCWREHVRYAVVLNQDAYMDADCVQRLAAFMDANPGCGIAAAVQHGQPGNTITWAGSHEALPYGVHATQLDAHAPFETYWANGACMMIRTQAVRECGVFDRNMRFIYSDVDFSFTLRSRGWSVHVVPAASCEHTQGASISASAEIEMVKCRDTLYFMRKWLTGGVYRALSREGMAVSDEEVRRWVAHFEREAQAIGKRSDGASGGPL